MTTAPDAPALSRRRQQTQERLLAAARAVFAEQGVSGATVEDICEAAGFTRGAFYSNFSSKDDLFFALLEREETTRLAQVEESLAQGMPDGGDPVDELVQRVLAAQPMDRQWFLIQSEFTLYAVRNPEAAERLNLAWQRVCSQLGSAVEAGLALAGRRLTISPDDAIAALMAVYDQSVADMLTADPAASSAAPELARRTMPQMIRGFSEPI